MKPRPIYHGVARANSAWPKDAPLFRVHGQVLRGLTPAEAGRFITSVALLDGKRLWEKARPANRPNDMPRLIAADLEARYPTTGDT